MYESATLNCTHQGEGRPGCLICDPRYWYPAKVETAEQLRARQQTASEHAQPQDETPR